VRFVRVVMDDLGPARGKLDRLVRRQLAVSGPPVREFQEVPRTEGRWHGTSNGDDGWLTRADDGVGRAG
jgi:hypothetical protein